MNDDTWHMYLISLASSPGLVQRPAIRKLYFEGFETDTIADACELDVAVVRDAILNIP